MPVITISGQIGAGAREVGRLVAERLGIDYVDQEILLEAARELGVPVESVVTHDERTAGLGERLANMLRRFLESSAAAGAADPMLGSGGLDIVLGRTYTEAAAEESHQEVSDEQYIETLSHIMRELADHSNVVIIGRGSQVILQDRPAALHVLLAGSLPARLANIAARDGVDEDEARKRLEEAARGRAGFHEKFFKVDVDDPALYHLALSTERLSYERVVELICETAQRVAPGGDPA